MTGTSMADQRVRAAADVAVRELDGELVLLNYTTEHYFGLDEVGARIWEVLVASPTVADAVRSLLEEFDVDEATLSADVEQLVGSLVAGGLVALEPG